MSKKPSTKPTENTPASKPSTSDIIRWIVMGVSVCVLIFSAVSLAKIFIGYYNANKINNTVVSAILQPVEHTSTEAVTDADGNVIINEDFEFDFVYDPSALAEINPDSIGFLYIPGIDVKLPVVQSADNNEYLKKSITGTYSVSGTLFVDYRLDGLNARNVIIYGHNMKDGSMFNGLHRYKQSAFYENGNNSTFYFFVGDDIYEYKIYSVYTDNVYTTESYATSYEDDAAFEEYIQYTQEHALYDTGVEVTAQDTIMTFSTCTSDDDVRLLVHAVRVK